MDFLFFTAFLDRLKENCIDDPKQLKRRHKEPGFAYGETEPIFVNRLRQQLEVKKEDVFLDIGSGIGSVVLQMVAQTGCIGVGIEIEDERARIASCIHQKLNTDPVLNNLIDDTFLEVIQEKTTFIHGDFLERAEVLKTATVVFINNESMAANPSLMNSIEEKLYHHLRDDTRIAVFQPFHNRSRSGTRNSGLVSILSSDVKQYSTPPGWVSWRDAPIKYYIYTVKRATVAPTPSLQISLVSSDDEEEEQEQERGQEQEEEEEEEKEQERERGQEQEKEEEKEDMNVDTRLSNFVIVTILTTCHYCGHYGPTVCYDIDLEEITGIEKEWFDGSSQYCSTLCAWHQVLKTFNSGLDTPARDILDKIHFKLVTKPLLAEPVWLDFNWQREALKTFDYRTTIPYGGMDEPTEKMKDALKQNKRAESSIWKHAWNNPDVEAMVKKWKDDKGSAAHFQSSALVEHGDLRYYAWLFEVDYMVAALAYAKIMRGAKFDNFVPFAKRRAKLYEEETIQQGHYPIEEVWPKNEFPLSVKSLEIRFTRDSFTNRDVATWTSNVYELVARVRNVKDNIINVPFHTTVGGCTREGCFSKQNPDCIKFVYAAKQQEGFFCSTDCAFLQLVAPYQHEVTKKEPSETYYALKRVYQKMNPIIAIRSKELAEHVRENLKIKELPDQEFFYLCAGDYETDVTPPSLAFPLYTAVSVELGARRLLKRLVVDCRFARAYADFFYNPQTTKELHVNDFVEADYIFRLHFFLNYSMAPLNPYSHLEQIDPDDEREAQEQLRKNVYLSGIDLLTHEGPVSISRPATKGATSRAEMSPYPISRTVLTESPEPKKKGRPPKQPQTSPPAPGEAVVPKKRGRPPKQSQTSPPAPGEAVAPKKRGRLPKQPQATPSSSSASGEAVAPKKRGRPRKHPQPTTEGTPLTEQAVAPSSATKKPSTGKRGRPKDTEEQVEQKIRAAKDALDQTDRAIQAKRKELENLQTRLIAAKKTRKDIKTKLRMFG